MEDYNHIDTLFCICFGRCIHSTEEICTYIHVGPIIDTRVEEIEVTVGLRGVSTATIMTISETTQPDFRRMSPGDPRLNPSAPPAGMAGASSVDAGRKGSHITIKQVILVTPAAVVYEG